MPPGDAGAHAAPSRGEGFRPTLGACDSSTKPTDAWRARDTAGRSTLLQFIGDEPGLTAHLSAGALGAGPQVPSAARRGSKA